MPSGVQGATDAPPTSAITGRHRKSTHALLALRRSTTTPTAMCASAVVFNWRSPECWKTRLKQRIELPPPHRKALSPAALVAEGPSLFVLRSHTTELHHGTYSAGAVAGSPR